MLLLFSWDRYEVTGIDAIHLVINFDVLGIMMILYD